jgi:hypothetical protein
MRIAQWNYNRDNINFDPELELRMLTEEAQEFKDGMLMLAKADAESSYDAAIVELVDAWCDYQFVMSGSIFKYLGSDIPFDWDSIRTQERYMFTILNKQLGIDEATLNICLDCVITANEAKGTKKIKGKIQKGDTWRDPKDTILNILKDADYV